MGCPDSRDSKLEFRPNCMVSVLHAHGAAFLICRAYSFFSVIKLRVVLSILPGFHGISWLAPGETIRPGLDSRNSGEWLDMGNCWKESDVQ
jgi:hypothetical protein